MTPPAVERFWADYLGCRPAELSEPGVRVTAHRQDYHGLYLLRREEACIVSAPPPSVFRLQAVVEGHSAAEVFSAAWLREALGQEVTRVIGPAFLGYRDAGAPLPKSTGEVRRLGPEDRPLLVQLRADCAETEWDHSGAELDHPDLFGLEVTGELAAVGALETWGELLHLGLLTHPRQRGKGYGRRVAAALCAEAAHRGKVPQYRALRTNHASLAVARALGFEEWGDMLAVRLRDR